ncbi:MAG TPA: carboxypeptidase-like regulatory domain-containing protein [Terriglobales bacterium]|nr:carboxypeptidase-like regulatory domain-containing protein [Terriglobales bacterium]
MRSTYLRAFVMVGGLVFASALIGSTPAYADNLYASIRGGVVDPSGAALPGVKLTATNTATGISYSTTSTDDGGFSFLQLPIGDYQVSAEKSGFKKFMAGHIHLDLDQIFSFKATMEIGATTEAITVEANPVQVDTTSMQLGTTVTGNQIVDIPLNGRNWTQLMQLQSGVMASSDRFGTGAFSTNGSQTQQNSFLINGTDSNDAALNVPLVIPSPDAIGEFSLVSSTLNPEYGRNSGAIVNAAIKSGTNQFHGDIFEFYRDTFLDAKSWFRLQASPFHQNEFGGTLGGPIYKDHAFFFFSYQGVRATQPETSALTSTKVFSAAERAGDFSADTSGLPLGTGTKEATNVSPVPLVGADGMTHPAGTPYATLFPTGVIPTADLNPLALKLMNQYVPLPNAPGNLFLFNPITTLKDDQLLGRIDEKVTNKDAIWFYGFYENYPFTDTVPFAGPTLPGFASTNPEKWYQYTAAWNHTFSPTMLNEARFAYLRFNYVSNEPASTIDPTAYGFSGIVPQNRAYESLPVINLTGGGFFAIGFSSDGPQPRIQNTYQLTDNLSKVWGHHTAKFGFNLDRLEINNPFYSNLSGDYSYSGAGTFSTGDAAADFLLGFPDSYTQGSGSTLRARAREYYSYAQDQWQVKPSLTLTLGVGWEILTPQKNIYANGEAMAAFRQGQQSKVFPSAPLGLVFPGDAGINGYGGPTVHYGDFGPRVGFAWGPGSSHRWSVRGGIGIYYNRTESETVLQTLGTPPFSLSSSGAGALGAPPNFGNPFLSQNPTPVNKVPAGTVAQQFPFVPPAPGTSPDFAPFYPIGFNVSESDPRMTSPRVTNYNLNVQYQLSNSTIATLGYVGAVGRHEEGNYDLNPAGVAPGVNFNPVAQACGSDFYLATCTGGVSFPLGAYSNVMGQVGVFATAWSSNYNSLQASINRRFTNGLQLQVAYTFSRSFDYISNFENGGELFASPGLNPYDIRQNYGPSTNDAPQRLVANFMYTLPFYKYGHHWKMLTDGWDITGIATFQSGFPVQVTSNGYNDLQWSYPDAYYQPPGHAQLTGKAVSISHNPRNSTIGGLQNMWVNPAAFAIPTTGTIGDANRNPFYGPGLNFWDMALLKNLQFTESKYLQLRLETFNTFNHANFAPPNSTAGTNVVGNANFGQITSVQQITTNGDGRVVQLGAKLYF